MAETTRHLVLGGGYLGSQTADALTDLQDSQVTVGYHHLARWSAEVGHVGVEVDMHDPETVRVAVAECEPHSIVLAMGAPAVKNGVKLYDSLGRTLEGLKNSKLEHLSHLVFIGSARQLDVAVLEEGKPISEAAPMVCGTDSDGAFKTQQAKEVLEFGEAFGIDTAVGVMCNPVGGPARNGITMPKYQLLPLIMEKIQNQEPINLNSDSRGYFYAPDAGVAIARLADPTTKLHYDYYNVGPAEAASNQQVIDYMLSCMAQYEQWQDLAPDINTKPDRQPYPDHVDTNRLANLGWQPTADWRRGVEEFVAQNAVQC